MPERCLFHIKSKINLMEILKIFPHKKKKIKKKKKALENIWFNFEQCLKKLPIIIVKQLPFDYMIFVSGVLLYPCLL